MLSRPSDSWGEFEIDRVIELLDEQPDSGVSGLARSVAALLRDFHEADYERANLHDDVYDLKQRVLGLEDENSTLNEELDDVKSDRDDLYEKYTTLIEEYAAVEEALSAVNVQE